MTVPRPDSRLDAEYDPAERHDLDRVRTSRPATGVPAIDTYRHFYVCCCGDVGDCERNELEARRAHDAHRDEQLGLSS